MCSTPNFTITVEMQNTEKKGQRFALKHGIKN